MDCVAEMVQLSGLEPHPPQEHGLIMEAPDFPLAPGKYLVTGGRETTAELTISPDYTWALGPPRGTASDIPARLYDVTHLPCRAARYSGSSPLSARQSDFPVTPGASSAPPHDPNETIPPFLARVGSCRWVGDRARLRDPVWTGGFRMWTRVWDREHVQERS
jgi:hypothetical protein